MGTGVKQRKEPKDGSAGSSFLTAASAGAWRPGDAEENLVCRATEHRDYRHSLEARLAVFKSQP